MSIHYCPSLPQIWTFSCLRWLDNYSAKGSCITFILSVPSHFSETDLVIHSYTVNRSRQTASRVVRYVLVTSLNTFRYEQFTANSNSTHSIINPNGSHVPQHISPSIPLWNFWVPTATLTQSSNVSSIFDALKFIHLGETGIWRAGNTGSILDDFYPYEMSRHPQRAFYSFTRHRLSPQSVRERNSTRTTKLMLCLLLNTSAWHVSRPF